MDVMNCQALAVPAVVMQHVVDVESAFNPYAIGVVGARLTRQPRTLPEAMATARMLADRGYNFSLGLAQVNRYNLARYGLSSYALAFDPCANLRAGSRILAECYGRSGRDWGKAFSCYYSGDFTRGFRDGYVQKVLASMRDAGKLASVEQEPSNSVTANTVPAQATTQSLVQRRTSMDFHGQAAATLAKGEPVATTSVAIAASAQSEQAVVARQGAATENAGVSTKPRDTAFVF